MPEQAEVRADLRADLQVVHGPPATVLLAGLPPVYAYGLSAVLTAGGLPTTVVKDVVQVPGVLAGAGPFVVVVPFALAGPVVDAVTAPSAHAVVVLVDVATAEVCATAVRAGVTGILAADDGSDDVLVVLKAAARGRTVLPQDVVRALCRPEAATPPSLTPTEQAWLRRLAAGGTVSALARSCGFSEREMYRRLSGVYLRLGARTRTEALLMAERFGVLAPAPPGAGDRPAERG